MGNHHFFVVVLKEHLCLYLRVDFSIFGCKHHVARSLFCLFVLQDCNCRLTSLETWRLKDCAFMQICSCSCVGYLDVAEPSLFIIFNSSQSSKSAFILNDLFESAGFQTAKQSTAYPFWDKGIFCQVICFSSHFVYVSCKWTWVFKHVS